MDLKNFGSQNVLYYSCLGTSLWFWAMPGNIYPSSF